MYKFATALAQQLIFGSFGTLDYNYNLDKLLTNINQSKMSVLPLAMPTGN
jgi:hypothetical protein